MFSFFKKEPRLFFNNLEELMDEFKISSKDSNSRLDISLLNEPITIEDAPEIFRMSKIKEDFMVKLFPHSNDLESTKASITTFYKSREKDNNSFIQTVNLIISENGVRKSGKKLFVGFIALLFTDNMTDILVLGSRHQLLFSILPEHRKRGYLKAALNMTLNRLYDLHYNICAAQVKDGNNVSVHLLEAAGFIRNGRKINDSVGFVKRLNMDIDSFNNFLS